MAALRSMRWRHRSFETRGRTEAALLILPLLSNAAWAWVQFRA